MKALLFFFASTQILCAQIFTDTTKWDSFHIEHDTSWQESDYGLINTFDIENQYIRYTFWGFGIDINTYQDKHHGGYILQLDDFIDTVSCLNESRRIWRTYFNHRLAYGNHTVTIRPYPISKTLVFRNFVTYVDSNPVQPPCYDTIFNVIDSIIPVDSTVIVWDTLTVIKEVVVLKDSTIYNFVDSVVIDTVVIPIYENIYDTIHVIVEKDSIRWIPTPCPQLEKCDPATWQNILLVVVSVMTVIFLILYFNEKNK